MNKEIFRLALPNILSNISVPLLSSVDIALMGHLSQENLAAVGIGSMIFNFLYWNFGFLRMGTTGMTAQAYGRSSKEEANRVLVQALLTALVLGGVLILAQVPLKFFAIKILNQSDTLIYPISEYFETRIWGAPANLFMFAAMGWFFGLQNAFIPLLVTILINITNIGLSFYFVHELGIGIKGVAWGTVVAQYLGTFVIGVIIYFYLGKTLRPLAFSGNRDFFKEFQRFVVVNRDIFLRTLCLTTVFSLIYSKSSAYGVEVLAVNTVLLQFLSWISYGVDGFAFATESLVGKYYGRLDKESLKRSISLCFNWSGLLALSYSLVFYLWGSELFNLFTKDQETLYLAKSYLSWFWVIPLIAFTSYIWDGVYIGLTASRAMRNSMFGALCIFLLVLYGLDHLFANFALWMALSLFLLSRSLIQWAMARSVIRV